MESFGGFGSNDMSKSVRKKRSNLYRRSWNDSQSLPYYRDNSSLSSTPPSDNVSKASSDYNAGNNNNFQRKELNLNQCSSRASYTNLAGGALASANLKSFEETKKGIELQSRTRDDNILKKVKLKVGGVTRTIPAKPTSDGASVGGSSSTKLSRTSDVPRPRKKLILQDNSDEDHSSLLDEGSGLQGVPWKDFSVSFSVKEVDSSREKIMEESVSMKQSDKYEPVRKSNRVPKRRLLDGALNDREDDEEEIRYLAKLRTSKVAADFSADYEYNDEVGNKKQRKFSKVLDRNVDGSYNVDIEDYSSSRSGKESKKSRSGRVSEDTDYAEDEESVSDGESEAKRNKQKEFVDALGHSEKEMPVTTRQRALQTGKDISSCSLIEFPNGLPPAPPKKQKEKLSEVEQQLKKTEAAQRRKMQAEKAARESEAEAIRKILGQDSSRKKREVKIKKRQEVLAQERTANSMTLASNVVRWVMGPTGTIVTFPNEMGLPSIFETKRCSYPPPREKCAGPSCTNPYKYRDSKSKLPLCSLQCYKAIREMMQLLAAC